MKTGFVFASCLLAAVFAAVMFFAGSLRWFIDLPSFGIAVLLPYAAASLFFPPGRQKAYFAAASGKAFENAGLVAEALLYLRTLSSFAAWCSAAAVLIGLISIFTNLRDDAMVGSGLAIMLTAPLYFVLLYLVIILPMRSSLLRFKDPDNL